MIGHPGCLVDWWGDGDVGLEESGGCCGSTILQVYWWDRYGVSIMQNVGFTLTLELWWLVATVGNKGDDGKGASTT